MQVLTNQSLKLNFVYQNILYTVPYRFEQNLIIQKMINLKMPIIEKLTTTLLENPIKEQLHKTVIAAEL